MRILAIILLISILIDIIFPIIKVVKAIKIAKEKNVDYKGVSLNRFLISEVLNVLALIFFILYLIKY